MSSYDGSRKEWNDRSGNGHTSAVSDVTVATNAVDSNGASKSFAYLSGTASSGKVEFGVVIDILPMSICTVSRYQPGPGAKWDRVVDSTTRHWFHGHCRDGKGPVAGTAYPHAWATPKTSIAGNITNWMYICSSIPLGERPTVVVNGKDRTECTAEDGCPADLKAPYMLGVNAYPNSPNASDFGIAELIVWDRALSSQELYDMQVYLSNNYGFPVPSAPTLSPTSLPSSCSPTSSEPSSSLPTSEPSSSKPSSSRPSSSRPSSSRPSSSTPTSSKPSSSKPSSSSPSSSVPSSSRPSSSEPSSSKPTSSKPTLIPTPSPSFLPGQPTPLPTVSPTRAPTSRPSSSRPSSSEPSTYSPSSSKPSSSSPSRPTAPPTPAPTRVLNNPVNECAAKALNTVFPDTVFGDFLGNAPDARNLVLDDSFLKGSSLHGGHKLLKGQPEIPCDSFRNTAINATAGNASWILASLSGTDLLMVELRVSVHPGVPATNLNHNEAYICGVLAGNKTLAERTVLTTALVNRAWSERSYVLYSNSYLDDGIGVKHLDYSIMLTHYPTSTPTQMPSSSIPSSEPSSNTPTSSRPSSSKPSSSKPSTSKPSSSQPSSSRPSSSQPSTSRPSSSRPSSSKPSSSEPSSSRPSSSEPSRHPTPGPTPSPTIGVYLLHSLSLQ